MDYLNDVFATFLSLDRVSTLAVYGRVRELSEFITNIFICVLKMNEGLTGLKLHEGTFILGKTIPFLNLFLSVESILTVGYQL